MKRLTLSISIVAGISIAAFAWWLQPSHTENTTAAEVVTNNEAEKKEPPTLGEKILEWRLRPWRDANGNIPAGLMGVSLATRDQYLRSGLDAEGFGDLPVSRLRWLSRGPDNVGGRTRQVIVDPSNSNILWAAAVGGGVWRSFDGGNTWTAMNGDLANYGVTSLTLDTNGSPRITLYMRAPVREATAVRVFLKPRTAELHGCNYPTLLPGPGSTCPTWRWCTVYRISVMPGNSMIVLASNSRGIYLSTDGGNTWPENAVAPGEGSRFVSFDPNNAQNAVGEVIDFAGNAVVMFSTHGGANWEPAQRNGAPFSVPARIELAYGYHGAGTTVVYAVNQVGEYGTEVSRSEDGGHTFTRMDTTVPSGRFIAVNGWATALWASASGG